MFLFQTTRTNIYWLTVNIVSFLQQMNIIASLRYFYLIDTKFDDALPLMFEISMLPVLRNVDKVEKYACTGSELHCSSYTGVL